MKIPQISAKEWRWALGWSVVILLLSCLPYIIAIFLAPDGWHFAGILVNPYDGNSYLAKMQQGVDGNWLFHLAYTPEPHQGVGIFTFYLALGHLARISHTPHIIIFHVARLITGFILLMVSFQFIHNITTNLKESRLAFILLLTASGLGWLGAILGAFPIDLWVPEAFVPYSLYSNPHFSLGIALMIILLQTVVWPTPTNPEISELKSRPSLKVLLLAGLTALILAGIMPFALLTVWAVLTVYLAWLYLTQRRIPWLNLWPAITIILFSAPIIFYDYWISSYPILAGWSAQNLTPAPKILDLILGYGLVGLFAVIGGWMIVRKRGSFLPGEWLLILWAVTTLILVYFPFFNLQRRLITGLHIPLCILAAIGLIRWLGQKPARLRYQRLITTTVIISGIVGTLFVWGIPLLGILQSPDQSETSALFFIRSQEKPALEWLQKNATSEDIVLASPRLGLFVPTKSSARVFYGHPFETLNAEEKKATVESFYRGEIETVSPAPTYIIYGPEEQAIGQPKNLQQYPVFFSTEDIKIYQVTAQ